MQVWWAAGSWTAGIIPVAFSTCLFSEIVPRKAANPLLMEVLSMQLPIKPIDHFINVLITIGITIVDSLFG